MDRDILRMDCRTCPVQGVACGGCMVTALLDPEAAGLAGAEPAGDGPAGDGLTLEGGVELALDRSERTVVADLVASGLVSAETAGAARARREPWGRWEELHETG